MFTQQIVNGLAVGATYALFALGFTLMFGILRIVNLTYGVYFSFGAFSALYFTDIVHLSVWAALLATATVSGIFALVVDQILLARSRSSENPEMSSLIVTLGATLFLYSLATVFVGSDIRRMPTGLFDFAVDFGGARVTGAQLLIFWTSVVIVSALFVLLHWTKFGLAIRAFAENRDATTLMGIDTRLIFLFVSFISGALGGIAGMLTGINYNGVQPFMGEEMMLKGFAVIIIGGLGDVRGAIVAGAFLGLMETFVAGYGISSLREAVAYILLVLVLWGWPTGLFGVGDEKRA